jgi:hypothetical protein
MTTNTKKDQPEFNPALVLDPKVLNHKREIPVEIGNQKHKFIWTRLNVNDLMEAAGGLREHSSETTIKAMERVLVNAVDTDTHGILLDLFKKPENFALSNDLGEMMMKDVTENQTKINTTKNAGPNAATAVLVTEKKTQVFKFKSDRQLYSDFLESKQDPDISPFEGVYNYLVSCLPEDQQAEFALLTYDEKNFTLPLKVFNKAKPFLFQTSVSIRKLTRKASTK